MKPPTRGAPGTIAHFAGGVGDGGPATQARLYVPGSVFVEPMSGEVYIADSGNDRIRMIDMRGMITTVAGNGVEGFNRDNQKAVRASLNNPLGVTADGRGNVYIADTSNNKVLKVDGSGVLTTVAGTGVRGFSGDGGPGNKAMLSKPYAVAIDASGNVVIADSGNHRVRRVDSAGRITTIAGTGVPGFTGDGGRPARTRLFMPTGVAIDRDGNLFIADLGNHRVRRINALTGSISTVAGNGAAGFAGDKGPASRARLHYPTGVATDRFGGLFIADFGNNRVRVVDATGTISTLAGSGVPGFSGDGGDARRAAIFGPWGVAVRDRTLIVAEAVNNRLRAVDDTFQISTIAGTAADGYSGDGGSALVGRLFRPTAVTMGPNGAVYIADSGGNRIRRVAKNGTISTVAGIVARLSTGDGGPARKASLSSPTGVAVDVAGNTYIVEVLTHKVRRIDRRGVITTIAGTGVPGYSGDRGPARRARLLYPVAVAADRAGNVYVADMGNSRIRKIDRRGIIRTFAGTGVRGPDGNGVPATRAQLSFPYGVAAGPDGTIYIADTGNNRIKKVTPDGVIHVVAGNGKPGFSGDEGDALFAGLFGPRGVAVAPDGTVYIADTLNQRIRKVTTSGTISTVAGEGIRDVLDEEGLPSRLSVLTNPGAVCVMADGSVLIADTVSNRILRLLPPVVP